MFLGWFLHKHYYKYELRHFSSILFIFSMSISVRQSQQLDPQILMQAIHKKASEAKYITISVNIKKII